MAAYLAAFALFGLGVAFGFGLAVLVAISFALRCVRGAAQ